MTGSLSNLDLSNKKVDKDYQSLLFDVKYDKEQFKDPETIGLLMYRLAREREQSNHMFTEIIDALGEMKSLLVGEKKSVNLKAEQTESRQMLSEVDEKMIAFVTKKGRVNADMVQKEFEYKGKKRCLRKAKRFCTEQSISERDAPEKRYFIG